MHPAWSREHAGLLACRGRDTALVAVALHVYCEVNTSGCFPRHAAAGWLGQWPWPPRRYALRSNPNITTTFTAFPIAYPSSARWRASPRSPHSDNNMEIHTFKFLWVLRFGRAMRDAHQAPLHVQAQQLQKSLERREKRRNADREHRHTVRALIASVHHRRAAHHCHPLSPICLGCRLNACMQRARQEQVDLYEDAERLAKRPAAGSAPSAAVAALAAISASSQAPQVLLTCDLCQVRCIKAANV